MFSSFSDFPKTYHWIILVCLPSVVAISSSSIWIDEGVTVYLASQSSLSGMFTEILSSNGSEIQMPGYMVYMWGWVKLFGVKEITLRASNLPFLILLLFSILLLPRKNEFKIISILLICMSPLVAYYMNEARSTISLFSFSGISLCGTILFCDGSQRQARLGKVVTILSITLGACFNLLAFFVIPAIGAFVLVHYWILKSNPPRIHQLLKAALVSASFLLPLSVYYLWTFARGSGGMRERPTLLNICYAVYEFVGFGGVGPPRNDLRQSFSVLTFEPYVLPIMLFGLVIFGVFTVLLLEKRRNGLFHSVIGEPFLMGFVAGLFLFSVMSFVVSFRFWGRHLLFIYPFVMFFVSRVLVDIFGDANSKHRSLKILLAFFAGFWLYSDFNLRFVEAYQKENYRLAVRTAVELKRPTGAILWVGSPNAAAYYGLDFPELKQPEGWRVIQDAMDVKNRSKSEVDMIVRENREAVLVVFAKDDLFDREHAWRDYVAVHQPRCSFSGRDFSIYIL
jgi:hypothetical protein